jgi:hypothetical protein
LRAWLAACAVLSLSGCAALLIGAGAAGGYAISKDSVTNHFDLPASHLFRLSRDVVEQVGLITVEDERRGLIKATVEGADVTVTVKPVSPKTVALKVRARQMLLPKIDVAQTLYNRILDRL